MNPARKIYCRIFQKAFRIAIPLLPYRKPDILGSLDELPELFGDQGQLRAGREAVQAADAPSRVRGFILLLGLYSCVVAAG